MSVRLDPPFPIAPTVAFIAIALTATVVLYVLKARRIVTPRLLLLIALRVAAVLALGSILLNPVRDTGRSTGTSKAPLVVLVDSSRSMSTADCGPSQSAKASRWSCAQSLVSNNKEAFSSLFADNALRFATFDETMHPTGSAKDLSRLSPVGARTNIADAIRSALSEMPGSKEAAERAGAILLLSDGSDNVEGDAQVEAVAKLAAERRCPIYTVTMGNETPHRDLQVVDDRTQLYSPTGETVRIGATLVTSGLNGAQVQLTLMRDGAATKSRVVRTAGERQRVSFEVTERSPGLYRYTLQASIKDDAQLEARSTCFLRVSDARIRVLLLEGEPGWDARFLAQALRADPALSVDTVFNITDMNAYAVSGDQEAKVAIPRTTSDFGKYDVVVLGKGYEGFFDSAATVALKGWVSTRGGSVVFLRAKADERTAALRELEPFTYTDSEIDAARVDLTAEGKSQFSIEGEQGDKSRDMVSHLPGLISVTRVDREKALAVVLARTPDTSSADAPEMALIGWQRYGDGKALAIVGDGLWRWQLLDPSLRQYDDAYTSFWSETIRSLNGDSDFLPGQAIALHTDSSNYSARDTVKILITKRMNSDEAVQIRITDPDGNRTVLQPVPSASTSAPNLSNSDLVATYQAKDGGEYLVEASRPAAQGLIGATEAATTFHVGDADVEDSNRSANPGLMSQIANLSGGQALSANALGTLAQRLKSAPISAQRINPPVSLWDRGWLIGLIVALLAAEWLLRQKSGMA